MTVRTSSFGIAGAMAALSMLAACSAASTPASQDASAQGRARATVSPPPLRDDGTCMTGAKRWEQAGAWASSFRFPGKARAEPTVEMAERELRVGARTVRVILQSEAYKPAELAIMRTFLFMELAPGRIAGCVVDEDHVSGDLVAQAPPVELRPEPLVVTDANDAFAAVHVHGAAPYAVDTQVICRAHSDGLGCAAFRTLMSTVENLRVVNQALWFEDQGSRRKVALAPGSSRLIESGLEHPIEGRSAAYRKEHRGAPAIKPEGKPIDAPTAADLAGARGKWRDHGACFSHASSWETAVQWARAFPPPEGSKGVEDALEADGIDETIGGTRVRSFVQTLRSGMEGVERRFIMIDTKSGITGCVVHDDPLAYGYQQSPKPDPDTVAPNGKDGITYRAHHQWSNASGKDENADWEVFCRIIDGTMGCVSANGRWTRVFYDDKGEGSPKVFVASLAWKGNELEWKGDKQTFRAVLAPGSSYSLSFRGVETPESRSALKP